VKAIATLRVFFDEEGRPGLGETWWEDIGEDTRKGYPYT
jgi:hypothetical protein